MAAFGAPVVSVGAPGGARLLGIRFDRRNPAATAHRMKEELNKPKREERRRLVLLVVDMAGRQEEEEGGCDGDEFGDGRWILLSSCRG